MKIESPESTARHSSSVAETAVLRDIMDNFRKESTASTISSTDLEINEYRSFPVDDDLFEFGSSTGTSLACDVDTDGNSSEGTSQHSGDSTPGISESHITAKASIPHDQITSNSMPSEEACSAGKCTEISSLTDYTDSPFAEWSQKHSSPAECRRSYYVSGDDLSPDYLSTSSSPVSIPESNDLNTHYPVINNSATPIRTYEVWSEIDSSGGVLEVSGCGVSFHVLPSKLPRKQQKEGLSSFRERLTSTDSTRIDRRIVITLDDVPMINNLFRVAVGSMVSVEYGNSELLSQGAILQIEINADLIKAREQVTGDEELIMLMEQNFSLSYLSYMDVKCHIPLSLKNDSPSDFKFGCLIASSVRGPFREVIGNCYHYGNTLQISISKGDIDGACANQQSASDVATLRLIPVVTLQYDAKKGGVKSVWDGIASMLVWVAVYGPQRSHVDITCCVSISTATVCPPTVSVKKNNKTISLHLWAAYRVLIRNPEDIQVTLKRDPDDNVAAFPSSIVIDVKDVKYLPRINKLITLKYTKEPSSTNSTVLISSEINYPLELNKRKAKEKFLLTLVGLQNNDILLAVAFVAPIRSPSWSTPVKRWRRNCKVVPRPVTYCGPSDGPQKFMYMWYDCQRDAESKLKPAFVFPGGDRKVCLSRCAVATTSRLRGKKVQSTLLLGYHQSDVMPLLTNTTLWMQGSNSYKEWYVGYSRGEVGLIHTKCVRIVNSEQCHKKLKEQPSVGEIIECLTGPIGNLDFSFSLLKNKLIKIPIRWTIFSAILGFGENYVLRVVREMVDDSTKDTADKLALFLDQFSEFCQSGNKTRKIHRDIVRALLYMEEYNIVSDLLVDFCVFTLSAAIANSLPELRRIFYANVSKDHLPLENHIEGASNPAYIWLNEERKRWSDGNDVAFLGLLHRAVGQLSELPINKWTSFSYAIILILSIPAMCQN